MNSFEQTNLEHIQQIFQTKTGVVLNRPRLRRPLRGVLILAAVIGCLTAGVAADQGLFSSLDEDDLSLNAVYQGDGVVSIEVENRSDRDLNFQHQVKLTRWTTSEELEAHGGVSFDHTAIPAHTTGTMTVDLSGAYDMEELERPLTDDWYYLTLTNHNFAFGQDWTCGVDFAENIQTPVVYPDAAVPDASVLAAMEDGLKVYFERSSLDVRDRREAEAEYIALYTKLFEKFNGTIVPSVSPVLPGNRISLEQPYLTLREPEVGVMFDPSVPEDQQRQLVGQNWFSRDSAFKLVAGEGEYALVVSALLPSRRYQDAGHEIPLFYVLTFEKDAVRADAHAFIYGHIISFADMAEYQVYEDEDYVCYEVSALMYADPLQYAKQLARQDADIRWDTQSEERLEAVYRYYKNELSNLFMYR